MKTPVIRMFHSFHGWILKKCTHQCNKSRRLEILHQVNHLVHLVHQTPPSHSTDPPDQQIMHQKQVSKQSCISSSKTTNPIFVIVSPKRGETMDHVRVCIRRYLLVFNLQAIFFGISFKLCKCLAMVQI